jgi:hypothetical protein
MRGKLEAEEQALRKARAEWRVLKGVVGGVVVGSGVNWAEDKELVEIVMDDGEE